MGEEDLAARVQRRLFAFSLSAAGLLPLVATRAIGTVVGDLLFALHTRAARTTRRNLSLCYPGVTPCALRERVRHSLRETARLAIEMACIWGRADWASRHLVASHGETAVREAIDAGESVLFLVPHLGNWEVLNVYLSRQFGLTAMYEPSGRPWLDASVRRAREQAGARLFPTDSGGVRALLAALKSAVPTAMLPDQVPDAAGGCYAPFFGRPTWTPTLPVRLAQRTRAAVFMATAIRTVHGFEVHMVGPHRLDGVSEAVGAALVNRQIEQLIDLAPDQYQWEYKRFRHRPESVMDYYK